MGDTVIVISWLYYKLFSKPTNPEKILQGSIFVGNFLATLLPLLANHPGRCPLATGNPSDPSGRLPTTMAAASCGTRASNNFIGPTRRSARLEWEMARQQNKLTMLFFLGVERIIVMKAFWRRNLTWMAVGQENGEVLLLVCIWSILGLSELDRTHRQHTKWYQKQ